MMLNLKGELFMKLIKFKEKIAVNIEPDRWYITNDHHMRQLANMVGNNPDRFELMDFYSRYREYDGSSLSGKRLTTIRTGGAGDLLFKTASFRVIKERWPDAEIHVYCAARYKDLLIDNPDIAHVGELPLLLDEWEESDFHLIFEGLIEHNIKATKINAYDLFLEAFKIDPKTIPSEQKIPNVVVNPDNHAALLQVNPFLSDGKRKMMIHMRASSPIRTPHRSEHHLHHLPWRAQLWNRFCRGNPGSGKIL